MQDFLVLAVFTAVCLSFKSSRNLGLVCLALLYLAYPYATVSTLLVSAGAHYYWRKHK